MAGGFAGKYCVVNLTTGDTAVVEPGESFYRKYLSGYGLGAAVIMERQKPGIDPLSSESYLGFCSGLLTDTGAYFSGRFMVVGKSPLTGGWGDANAGGFLSRELKRTGYDAVFFTGASEKPVWVYITDARIEIRDASSLWGKDILETEDLIKKELDEKLVRVASIGVSGEKCSLISGIAVESGRMAARSGLGAVMGSKKLKAVAFRGKQRVAVAQPDTVKEINDKFLADYKKSKLMDRITLRFANLLSKLVAFTGISIPGSPSLLRETYRKYGTSGLTFYGAAVGDMPIKNWGGVGYLDYTFRSAAKASDKNVIKYQKRRYACQSCPLGCGGIIDIEKGRYRGITGHKPEYETIGAFGGLLLQDDFDAIIEMNEMCNRAGIDTLSTGGAIAFAIECFENGIIDEKTTGGLKLGWGKTEEIVTLAEMIIQREGFGDILADGVKRAAGKIGQGSEKFAIHAGGQELPMHDSRLDPGFAIAYACEPTPGRHSISSYQYSDLFNVKRKFPEARRMIKYAKGKTAKKVRRYTAGSFYMQLVNCGGMCLFGALTSNLPVVEYMNAVTGWNLTHDEYFKIGERILSLRKAFNMREGIRPEDHRLSDRALGKEPLSKGPIKGASVDMDSLMKEFFNTVGWDMETGGPTLSKMKELEIDSLFS
ncbi:MAG: aldehyde ferredoxin oxidoreductase family protein [Deltaproteobacteria bacterium]|nr:aldehyde ferredoxin oxidoreductase family protein [Deltaproteobacteria bacterium]